MNKNIFNSNIGLKGHWDLEVIHHHDGTREKIEFDNLIVDNGLDLIAKSIGGSGYVINSVAVGTGNNTPSPSDTTLQSPIAITSTLTSQSVSVVSSTAPYIIQNNYVFTFAIGAVVGNITEIAALPSGSVATSNVFSRALIQVSGSPAAIELVDTDQLIATYQLQTIIQADITGTLNVNTDGVVVSRNYTIKPIGMTTDNASPFYGQKTTIGNKANGSGIAWKSGLSTNTSLSPVTSNPYGSNNGYWDGSDGASVIVGTYVNGSKNIDFTYKQTSGHPITWQTACFCNNWVALQLLLDSPIELTADQTFSWEVSFSWSDASGA